MSLAFVIAPFPALAEVCDKVLGEGDVDRLMGASLSTHAAQWVLSPFNLAALGIALLAVTRFPPLGWLSGAAGLLAGALAIQSIDEAFFSPDIVASAQREGCASALLAPAIVLPIVAGLLLAACIVALMKNPERRT